MTATGVAAEQDGQAPIRRLGLACCGCESCVGACPSTAIEMQPDEQGFLYPCVDASRCNGCGLCGCVCPVITPPQRPDGTAATRAFAAWHTQAAWRASSASGGAFTALAQSILSSGGLVFGAAMDRELKVRHVCVESIAELPQLQDSKYVQSSTGSAFADVRRALQQGRRVLFAGTPCQTAGLLAFLRGPHEGLTTCDVICAGVPSPRVWNEYLAVVAAQYGRRPVAVRFRDKSRGWRRPCLLMRFADGKDVVLASEKHPYYLAFYRALSVRPSCAACPAKGLERACDLTLADFWGLQSLHPEWMSEAGVSLVLAHTRQGVEALQAANALLETRETDPVFAVAGNPMALRSCRANPMRERFFRDLRECGYEFVARRYLRPASLWRRGVSKFVRIVRKAIGRGRAAAGTA